MFCRGCSLLAAAAFAAPAGARSIFVRVTSTPSNALSKLSGKVKQEGLDRKQKATKYYLRPSLLRQRAVSDALYHKAKNERVKLVEELVLQKNFFPW